MPNLVKAWLQGGANFQSVCLWASPNHAQQPEDHGSFHHLTSLKYHFHSEKESCGVMGAPWLQLLCSRAWPTTNKTKCCSGQGLGYEGQAQPPQNMWAAWAVDQELSFEDGGF